MSNNEEFWDDFVDFLDRLRIDIDDLKVKVNNLENKPTAKEIADIISKGMTDKD